MKIAFLLAGTGISGGNYVVYQHALWARQRGHDVTIATLSINSSQEKVWHPAISILNFKHIEEIQREQYDVAISTYWRTALELHKIRSRQYINFIQSIESRFYDESAVELRSLIDSIYKINLPVITEAKWIKNYLECNYDSRCELVRNGIRKDLYQVDGPQISERKPGKLRVLVEGAFGRIKNTARAMAVARKAGVDEIWLLTTSDIPWYPHATRVFSNIAIDLVPPIYRSCDAIIKLSFVEGMFGPPLEMFHCGGTAVVYDVSGHDEYIVDKRNALVVPMHDEAAAIDAVRKLRDDAKFLNYLKNSAIETAAAWPSWDLSSDRFMNALEQIVSTTHYTQDQLFDETERLRERYQQELIQQPSTASSTGRTTVLSSLRRTVHRCRIYANNVIDGYR